MPDPLIDAAIRAARRAPSAHNTQPWLVHREGESVRARVDPARTLPLADPTHQDTLLGMGAWVECLAIALGSAVTVTVSGRAPQVEVVVTPSPGPAPEFSAAEISRRQVDRGRLRPDPVAVAAAIREFHTLKPLSRVVPLRERDWRQAQERTALDIARNGAILRETLSWLRLEPERPEYHRDGLSAECLRIPAPVAKVAARLIRSRLLPGSTAIWHPVAARLYRHREKDPPARLVLAAPPATAPAEVIGLGRELLRCWLVLGRHGLRVSVNSGIKDNPVTAAGLPTGSFAVFSAGVSTSPPPRSARLG